MQTYYSREALDMDQWAREENNRVKASRIFKAAQSLEQRYRAHHKPEHNEAYRLSVVIGKPPCTGASITQSRKDNDRIMDMLNDPSPFIW
jgi:hypothetical protein